MVNRISQQGILISPLLPGQSQKTVLLTPITEVVDSRDIPTGTLVQLGEETTDDGTSQMAGVERLGNIGRGEFDNDLLLSGFRVVGVLETVVGVLAIILGALSNGRDNELGKLARLEEECNKRAGSGGFLD